jgi:hypothetical protein
VLLVSEGTRIKVCRQQMFKVVGGVKQHRGRMLTVSTAAAAAVESC